MVVILPYQERNIKYMAKNVKKILFFLLETLSVCGYLFCLYAGITAKFPFLNEYTEGNIRDGSGGYLWEVLGMLFWTGAISFIFISNKIGRASCRERV